MINPLLVLVDGSVYTPSVCDHAAWIAGRTGAPVLLAHVLAKGGDPEEPANLSGSIGFDARSTLLDELSTLDQQRAKLNMKRGRLILEDARKRLEAAGVKDVQTRLQHGEFVDSVNDLADDTTLLVIGKRGEEANFDTLHLGVNLERVIRGSDRPVFLASREFKPIKQVLFAFDGSPSALRAVEHVANRKMFTDLECRLLTVGDDMPTVRRQLDDAAERLTDAGYSVTTEVVAGQPDQVIGERVRSLDTHLLIMGAYGHSRIRSLIIGSTTTSMIRSCLVPVLLVR